MEGVVADFFEDNLPQSKNELSFMKHWHIVLTKYLPHKYLFINAGNSRNAKKVHH